MEKALFISIITFFCFYKLNAQNERDIYIKKAKIALNNGDTTNSLELYSKAFEFKSFTPFDHLKVISLLVEKQEFEYATELIEDILSMGYPFASIESKDLNGLQLTEHWSALLINKDSIINDYLSKLDQDWVRLLENMAYIDQEIRKPYMKSMNDSILKRKTLFAMELVDSINLNNLFERTQTNGFPTYETVGYLGLNNVWLILWHHRGTEFTTNPIWIELKPYIEKAINEGDLPKDFLVMFVDHNEIESGKPMIYGSLFGYYRGQPEYDTIEILEIETLNQRRLEKGMAPIELWLESMKLPIPKALK